MNVLRDGEVWLHGTVGAGFFRDGFTAADVADALTSIGRRKPATVHLNSGGGIASEGSAIHSVLEAHQAPVKVIIEGVAASAASLIAMAGSEIVMKKGSIMMIHDPSGITAGTSDDHQKTVEALEAMANSMADVYASKANKTREQARADMKEEVWLTPDAAKKLGYCDTIDRGKAQPIAAFDYRLYENAPDRFVALAEQHNWSVAGQADSAAEDEENSMTEKAKGGTASTSVAIDSPEFTAAVATAVAAALKKTEKGAGGEETTPASGTETTEQITARVRQEEQKRMADITAACSLAGQPNKAAQFISDNKSLAEVVTTLQADRVKGTGGTSQTQQQTAQTQELNAHRTNAGGGSPQDLDTKAAWGRATKKINAKIERRMAAAAAR